ncbi:probable calcium-binding protein CML31 [Punica granatum]|uniref:EF-hand domain-containing protein n=2 Tax=Punica granatum TaxID=22663 RepID=A0A218X863_PUNGR|nr:probable calcium-binding protein CML31 [Punica granatum]OWM81133.1 hypothetical protein CDL15_Pgr007164 [Punica granatum]PKI54722.1 hypothetical protein CRG98_024922 [Punica granatum]
MGFLSKKSDEAARSSAFSSPERDNETSKASSSPPKSALERLRHNLSPKKLSPPSPALDVVADGEDRTPGSGGLQPVFDYFDENGDGRISPVELRSCVNALGGVLSEEEAEVAIRASDEDGDGLLRYEEFERLVEGCGEEERDRGLREAFGMYEMKGKGYITAASLKKMLSRLGQSRSIDDCKAMIMAFDLNGDGVLTFDEFRVMMR